tara:strand:- start:9391 stop:11706 length:2316 start_codon:yes stop_codon:yes gene_type:complete
MRSFRQIFRVWLFAALAPPALGASVDDEARLLSDYLDALNDRGQAVIYSSDLVTDGMLLAVNPESIPTRLELQEMLRPFGLTATTGPAGSWLIVSVPGQPLRPAEKSDETGVTPIPEIVVTSSLHRLDYARPATHTYLDRELAARIATTADETVRLTHRLPGTAGGGLSTQNHVRGGEVNETLFLFDGLRLYEPYHLKNFQSIATIVNSNAIGGMDFYTGAYPVHYGDRMSAVLDIEMRKPEKATETELALSFFNASVLSMGTFGAEGQGDWLVSARRGNLDLIVDIIDPDFGSPDYQDYLLHAGWEVGPRAQLSANFLVSDDKLRLVDLDRGEQAVASYSNQVGWLKWRADWSESLSSDSILAISDITDRRSGDLALPGIVTGSLDEVREFSAIEFRQDWRWVASDTWMLRYGLNIKNLDATYRFSSVQSVAPPFDTILDNQPSTSRDFNLAPAGAQYAAYAEFRWRPRDTWTFDIGIRWDQQNYTTAQDDKQYSPRASILYQASEKSELRFGWGRYYQAQEINELQVSDGMTDFSPAQQAEHFVVNYRHQLTDAIDTEITVYRKSFRHIQPRFENSFNTLSLLPELQFDRIMVDPSGAEALGVELTMRQGAAGDDAFWWVTYAWSEIEDQVLGDNVVRSWDQTHTLKGGLSWRWGEWDLSTAAEVHTGWPRTLLSGEQVMQPGGAERLELQVSDRNVYRNAVFQSLDFRISRDFELARSNLTAFLEVSNLYDRRNPCCVEYSLQPDGALASRNKHWLPLVPSLGIVWRF